MGNQKTTRAIVTTVTQSLGQPGEAVQGVELIALYNPDNTPYAPYGSETKVIPPKVVSLTDAATIAVDASAGNHFTVTLAGNRTLGVPTNPTDGQRVTFEVKQDGTGSHTLAYSSSAGGYGFGAGSAPTVTATALATSLVEFTYSARVGKWLYRTSQLGF